MTQTAPPTALVGALRRLLRPLIRLLLDRQIQLPYLVGLLKSVYVEVAEEELPIPGRPQTDSRITLLTGVHRKDVRRLRAEPRGDESAPRSVSLGANLVARWMALPGYVDAEGRPLPLPRRSEGGGPSFDALVRGLSQDIRPRAILDEWLRLGIARVDEDGQIRLESAAFVPERGFEEKAFYFGRNLHDHLAAAAHNLAGGLPPFVERSVYYDRLTPESVEELAALAERAGMEALQTVNRRALELQTADSGRAEAERRMNFGIYFFDDVDRTRSPAASDDEAQDEPTDPSREPGDEPD